MFPFVMLLWMSALAQPAKKTNKPPTVADMQKAMKEAQKELDKLSPEDKEMMEEMGIKMPDFNKPLLKGVTDKQLQQAYEDDKLWVPRKNTPLITKAGKKLANEAELKSFLTTSCLHIKKGLGPKNMAETEQVIKELKERSGSGNITPASAATLLMLAGKSKLALGAFQKAFEQPTAIDYNDLNNFAALCNMMGGVQVSLPVLNFMDSKFPDNAIVLNNIGQAWFSCGDKDQAKAFFLKCTQIVPDHAQANEGLANVYMAEGNVAQAQACIKKSVKKAYSQEKVDKAKKMGYKIGMNDYTMPQRLPQDPLGFQGIEKPVFQQSLETYQASMEKYESWKEGAKQAKAEVQVKYDRLNAEVEEKMSEANIKKAVMQVNRTGDIGAFMNSINLNPMAIKVGSYFAELNKNSPTYAETFAKSMQENAKEYYNKMATVNETSNAMVKEANQWIDKNCIGCGQKVTEKECCDKSRAAAAFILSAQNELALTKLDRDIDAYTKFQREDLYYKQYMLGEQAFEMSKLSAKMEFINMLTGNSGTFIPPPCLAATEKNNGSTTLSKFEDTHCPYEKFTISDPSGILKATFSCAGTTKELDLPFLKMTQVNDMDDKYVKGSAWVGVSAGVDRELGPFKIGAEAGAGFFVEMSATQGFTDYGVTAGVEGKIGANADMGPVPSEIKVGVNGKVSFTSGTATATGSGLFDGISVSNK